MAREKFEKDTWLYGSTEQRKAVEKAAKEGGGLGAGQDLGEGLGTVAESAAGATTQFLTESPRERATRERKEKAATITNWGGKASGNVAVSKAKSKPTGDDEKDSNEPPVSRQLRDPFTTFYVQGIALEPPLPPDRLLNLTEENALHSACLMAKATDACGRGWSFEPKDGKKLAPTSKKPPEGPKPGMPQPEPGAPPQPLPKPGLPAAPTAPLKPGEVPAAPPKPGQAPVEPAPTAPGAPPVAPGAPGAPGAPKPGEPDGDEDLIYSDLPEQLKQVMEDLTPDLTFTELLYQAAWEMDAIGWSAWEVVRLDNDGKPGVHGKIAAIYPIPAHTLRASLDPRKWVQIRAGRVRYFKKFGAECTINNETGDVLDWKDEASSQKADAMGEDYVASELIIFKTYTPRSLWYGLPRWVSSIATIAELSAIREFNVSWFASGGQVDYHLHFKADNIEEARTMKEEVEQQIREFAGRGHTNLFTAGGPDSEVTANKLGDLLREGHFRFRRTDLIKEVLIAHNVPPYRIGWAETGALGGNAAPEMLGAYQNGAIKPIQQVIEDRLRVTLFDPEIGIKTDQFRFKLKEMELEDVQSELALATAGTDSGWMTPNQAREATGLKPDEKNPALNEYYYKGTKLGQQAPVPGMPNADGSMGTFPGQPKPPGADGAAPETDEDQGQPGQGMPTPGKPNPFGKSLETKAADTARAAMVDMLRLYEKTLKSALLVDNDPIDSEQPPVKKPQRGRGAPRPVTSAGPARDDKPNIA